MYLEEPPRAFADDMANGKISFSGSIALDEELSEGFRVLNEFMEKSKGKAADELHEDAFELKFMHHLCELGFGAENEEKRRACLKQQKKILNDHLLKWVPDFCDALYEYKQSDFYKGIAKLTKGFLLLEDAVIVEIIKR